MTEEQKDFRIKKGVVPYGGRLLKRCTIYPDGKVAGYIDNKYKTYGPYVYTAEEVEPVK